MADKNTIADWDPTTAINNDNVGGISLQENVMRPPAVNNAFREIMRQMRAWFNTNLFRVFDSTDTTKALAFDLTAIATATTRTMAIPNKNGTLALTSDAAGRTDVRRNHIVNGDKLSSQENAQAAGTNNGRYISCQNAMYFSNTNGVYTGVNVAGRTSPRGGNRDRITITTADTNNATNRSLTYTTNLEGSNVADLKWGASDAIQAVIRRGIRAPAGTWPVVFHNSAGTRTFVTTVTVPAGMANQDVTFGGVQGQDINPLPGIVVPGDLTGTWLNADGVIGVTMDFVIGAGSTLQGVAGWQAGNILTVSGATNGMAMSGAVFEFFDEGLRLDPDATGVYGQYEVGQTDAVYRTERYFYSMTGSYPLVRDFIASGDTSVGQSIPHPIRMAKTPAMTKLGTWYVLNLAQPAVDLPTPYGYQLLAGTVAVGPGISYPDTGSVTANARLS